MVLRVVWTTGETMETFSPTSRFSSVDLPPFVRPTMPTVAQRGVPGSGVGEDMAYSARTRSLPAESSGG